MAKDGRPLADVELHNLAGSHADAEPKGDDAPGRRAADIIIQQQLNELRKKIDLEVLKWIDLLADAE